MKRDVRQRPLTGLALLERCHGEMDTTFRHTNICTHLQLEKKKGTGNWTRASFTERERKKNTSEAAEGTVIRNSCCTNRENCSLEPKRP